MSIMNNSFSTILSQHREGWSLHELSQGLEELVKSVRQTGKGGSLTYTIKIKPASRGLGNALSVEDTIKVNPPELERDNSIFFATEQNTLTRENPNQKMLDLKAVPPAKVEEPRDVPDARKEAL